MPNILKGDRAPSGRYGIVVSRYNESVTAKLLAGAVETLSKAGVADGDIDVLWVPGAWELPVLGEVAPPSAVLIRPDGYVGWAGEGTDEGLRDAVSTWFGPPASA